MSHYRHIIQTFWCDAPECMNSYEREGTYAQVWAEARSVGWSTKNGDHFCALDHRAASVRVSEKGTQ